MELITALLPIRNGFTHLPRIRTALERNCRPTDQILIVNDHSSDGTAEYLDKWQLEDSRVLVLKNTGEGLVDALNLGIETSSNPWIARFDVDDSYPDDRLEKQRKHLNEETAAVFCDYEFMDEDLKSLGFMPSPVNHEATVLSLIRGRRTPHPGSIFNRRMAIKAGKYQQHEFPAEDLGLWLRIAQHGKMKSVPEVLLRYRVTQHSISSIKRNQMLAMRNSLILASEVIKTSPPELQMAKSICKSYKNFSHPKPRTFFFLLELWVSLKFISDSQERKRLRFFVIISFARIFSTRFILKVICERIKRAKIRN